MPSPNANSVLSKLPKIPAFKRDLIALWKGFGPGWMLAALVIATLPWTLAGAGYFVTALTGLLKVIRA